LVALIVLDQRVYLSLIVPCYREAERIGPSIIKIYDYLSKASYQSEVIIVDDGSPDATLKVITDTVASLPQSNSVTFRPLGLKQNLGKGGAVRSGMLAAEGEIRIFTDADLSTPIYEVEKAIKVLTSGGFDVVIGSRAIEGRALVKKHQPWYREAMGRFFNLLVQLLVLKGIKDTQCGFKGFTDAAAKKIFEAQKVMGFSFDVEILYLAKRMGYKVKEIAVEWYNDERTTVGALGDSSRMFFELLRIRRLHK
jgi:dolichyl-phosphate beta-glucosyltransferase